MKYKPPSRRHRLEMLGDVLTALKEKPLIKFGISNATYTVGWETDSLIDTLLNYECIKIRHVRRYNKNRLEYVITKKGSRVLAEYEKFKSDLGIGTEAMKK